MKRIAVGLALLAAGCSSGPAAEPPPPTPAPTTPVARAPLPQRDACGAAQHQHLVGRPRSEIPVPVRPDLRRVACTTCPVTMDFNAYRLNFFFDASTGVIKEIRCG